MLAAVSIPNLISGVSQQPITMRLSTSCDEMINAWPSVVSGLNKRAPSQHIAKINQTIDQNAVGYLIDRDDDYRFIVVISGNDLKVFDLDGVEQTVTFPNGRYYLNAAYSPVTAFRFLTLGDTTFVLNREVLVAADEFGEVGADTYVPTGTVPSETDLPPAATVGDVYFVTSSRTYWKFVTVPSSPAIYGWEADSSWTSTFIPSTAYVTSLPQNPSFGQTVYLKQVINVPTQQTVYNSVTRSQTFQTVIVPTTKYIKYKAVLTQAAGPAVNQWQQQRLADLMTLDATRIDPTGYATVFVKQAVANTNYNVYVNNVLKATYLSPKGVDAASSVPDTAVIAEQLKIGLTGSGYTCVRNGSTVTISGLIAGTTVQSSSSQGDSVLKAYTDSVMQFTDLPPNEVEGRIIKVKGDVKTNGDDYYVIWKNNTWTETYAYNESGKPNPLTMPHVLRRKADLTWEFIPWTWDARLAGSRDSNPNPSFFANKINDMFLYSNRLGFLSDENVILSEADNFENFYKTSLAIQVDSDPLDLAVLNDGLDIMRHGVAFDKDLLLMGDQNQFRLSYTQYLGPKNVQIQYTTSFNVSPDVHPVNMGGTVFFADDRPTYNYMKVWEYFPKDNRVGDDADDTTAPVPEYLPSGVTFMTGSPRIKTVLCNSKRTPDTLYLYKYFWTGNTKIQNAWFKWQFEDCLNIYWAGFTQNYLYILLKRNDGTFLERISIEEVVSRNDILSRVTLDRQVAETRIIKSYNSGTGLTTLTLPYSTTEAVEVIVTNNTGNEETTITDYRMDVTKIAGNQVTVVGDITGYTSIRAGINYSFLFRFSPPFFKIPKNSSEITVLDVPRVQLRYMRVQYTDTAYFQTRTAYPGRDDAYTTFDGKIVGDAQNIIGRGNFISGIYSIPLMGNSQDMRLEIINDSPFACTFASAEWTGIYSPRATKRM